MRNLFIMLMVAVFLMSCQQPTGEIGGVSYLNKPLRELISDVGSPAKISLIKPSGPFSKPTQEVYYYFKDENGKISPYRFWIQDGLVFSQDGHPAQSTKVIDVQSGSNILSIINCEHSRLERGEK